ncbi:MAG: hypothetical protein RMJ66_02030 [Bacteroidia bacterium]|nr:hypothetical protein [Bacteroidia bacterium]MDW8133825.1 hypothetical protein [Bacteroidia bacterium]
MLGRMIFHFVANPPIHAAEDLDIALHLAAGEGFSIYDRGPTTAKGPVYPLFLCLFLMLGAPADDLWQVVLVQHFLLSWIPYLMYRLSVGLGIEKLGEIVGWLFALHPSFWYYPTVLENTSLFIFATCLWGIGLVKLRRGFNRLLSAGVGLWWGLVGIEKPVAFIPMGIVILFMLSWRKIALIAMFAMLPVAGWALRGYLVFGYPTWTKTYAAQHSFAMSWHPSYAFSPRYAVSESIARQIDSLFLLPEKVGGPALAKLGKEITQQVGTARIIERTILNAFIFWWIPPRYWGNNSLPFIIARKAPVIIINILFIIGLLYGSRRYKALTLFILGVSLFFTLFYAVGHVHNTRYRLDVEWLQLFVCAMGVEKVRQVLLSIISKM